MSGPRFFCYARKILQTVAWLAPLFVVTTVWPTSARSQSEFPNLLQAQFRGCESAGWCKFRIESLDPMASSLYRVYPDGVAQWPDDVAKSVAVRDRLNALLASMVHQHKRIVLHGFRQVGDDVYSAIVTVNGTNIATDPIVLELGGPVSPAVSPGNNPQ